MIACTLWILLCIAATVMAYADVNCWFANVSSMCRARKGYVQLRKGCESVGGWCLGRSMASSDWRSAPRLGHLRPSSKNATSPSQRISACCHVTFTSAEAGRLYAATSSFASRTRTLPMHTLTAPLLGLSGNREGQYAWAAPGYTEGSGWQTSHLCLKPAQPPRMALLWIHSRTSSYVRCR